MGNFLAVRGISARARGAGSQISDIRVGTWHGLYRIVGGRLKIRTKVQGRTVENRGFAAGITRAAGEALSGMWFATVTDQGTDCAEARTRLTSLAGRRAGKQDGRSYISATI